MDQGTALWMNAKRAWPGIEVPEAAFLAHLARCRPDSDGLAQPVRTAGPVLPAVTGPVSVAGASREPHVADLYLALACARGDPAALKALDEAILSRVPEFLARMDAPPWFCDEVRQTLREKLLTAPPDGSPRIADYRGLGPLEAWVRVAAVRTAVSLRRGFDERHKARADQAALEALPANHTPELAHFRALYQNEFKDALKTAFGKLSDEERHVLRLHYACGMTGDAIAKSLRVNRRTVVRRLASARMAMFYETRALLEARLRLSPAELGSLISVVRSQLDVSVTGLLAETS